MACVASGRMLAFAWLVECVYVPSHGRQEANEAATPYAADGEDKDKASCGELSSCPNSPCSG